MLGPPGSLYDAELFASMDPVVILRVLVSIVVASAAAWMALLSQRYQRTHGAAQALALGAGLLAAVWLPQWFRDAVFAVGAAVVAYFAVEGSSTEKRFGLPALAFVFAYFIAQQISGGSTMLFLGGASVVGVVLTYFGWAELARLERAARLVPGTRVEGEVDFGGRTPHEPLAPPPKFHTELVAAAWQIEWQNGERSASPDVLLLTAEHGSARVSMAETRLRVDDAHEISLPIDKARPIARALGMAHVMATKPGEELPTRFGTLRYLPPDSDVYVLGTPVWEQARGLGYRDSALVPVFAGDSTKLCDVSALEVERRARWAVSRALIWGSTAASIAVAQLMGWI
jgi:hypothetical protein